MSGGVVEGGTEDRPAERWCVLSRDGWCLTKHNRKPAEGADAVPTACGWFVVLPGGFDQREPTCRDCVAFLARRTVLS
jgi:hypothetical protein